MQSVGMFEDTKRYVDNVLALQGALRRLSEASLRGGRLLGPARSSPS